MRTGNAGRTAGMSPSRWFWVTVLTAYGALAIVRARQSINHWADSILLPGWATPLAVGSLAMLLLQSFDHQYVRGNLAWSIFVTATLVILFLSLYRAVARHDERLVPARKRPFTCLLILILAADTVVNVALLTPHLLQLNRYSTDAGAATDCATQMVLHGRNPYVNLHMLTCLDSHGLHFSQTTPKSEGALHNFVTFAAPDPATVNWYMYKVYNRDLSAERADNRYPYHYSAPEFEERFNYPGGAILFGVVSWMLGARDLVTLYLLAALGASLWIYRSARPEIRTATGLLLLADLPLLIDTSQGVTDVLYALILIAYWRLRDRPILAGMALGLAAATRQQVWFFVPFLLYLGWREGGWADLRRRGSTMVVIFLASNIMFIAPSPSDWLAGILGPMRDPLFAQGIGVISLAIAVFKQHPGTPFMYTLLEAAGFLFAFRLFMKRFSASPGLAMLLPLMPIALAWRSLHTYFVVLPLLAIAVLAAPALRREAHAKELHTDSDLAPAA